MGPKPKAISRDSFWFQIATVGLSLALCFAVIFIFWVQPDEFAAILVLPRWLWIGPGLVLALLGWTHKRKLISTTAIILWLLYGVFFVQELRTVVRWRSGVAAEGAGLRLITLNCNGGNESAAAEVKAFHPDLVFFEESPLRPVVRKMATNLLGPDAKSFCSSDVSLLARGKVTPVAVENQESAPFIHAKVKFSSGFVTDVIVLRLQPYNIRADLWSPECWRNQAAIRRRQREQFEWIRRELDKIPPNEPILLGGDFNLPAGDKLFGILKPRVRETFREAGHGWGDTLDDNIPVLRIDQIWCDEHFRVVSSEAHQTVNSDHRMVICNLSIVGSGEAESREKTDVPLSKK